MEPPVMEMCFIIIHEHVILSHEIHYPVLLVRRTAGVTLLLCGCCTLKSQIEIVYLCVFLRVSKIGYPLIMVHYKSCSFLRIFIKK